MCVYGFKSDLNTSDGNSNVNSTKAWFVRSTSLRPVLAELKSHLSLAWWPRPSMCSGRPSPSSPGPTKAIKSFKPHTLT